MFATRRTSAALAALEAALVDARASADDRPPLVVLCLLSRSARRPPSPRLGVLDSASLRQARDDWLRRLETCAQERERTGRLPRRDRRPARLVGAAHRSVFEEATIVDYLSAYEHRAHPAPATYYRRFLLLRRFLRWVSRRDGVPDPFLDLDPPPKPRQERDWLTREEFRRLLDAAGTSRTEPAWPRRARPARPAHARHDRTTPLRAVRARVAGPRPRRTQAVAARPPRERRQAPVPAAPRRPRPRASKLRDARAAQSDRSCLLRARRRTPAGDDPRRHHPPGAETRGIEKHVTAHTLRHTAATWLRQELGDTRLVAEYLGHADLSTVARYAHVDRDELFDAAGRLEQLAAPPDERLGAEPACGTR